MRMISALRDDVRRAKRCKIVFKNECFNIFFALINSYARTRLIIIAKFLWRIICVTFLTQLIINNLS